MINNVDESVFHFDALSLILSFNPTIKNKFNIIEEFYKLKYCSTVVYMVPRA